MKCSLAYLELCPQYVKLITDINISEILVQFMKHFLKAVNTIISSYCIQCRPRADPRDCGVYVKSKQNYLNVPRFSDGWVVGTQCRPRSDYSWRSSLIRVYTVCHSICTFWTHYSIVQPPFSNFRVIKAKCSDFYGTLNIPKMNTNY